MGKWRNLKYWEDESVGGAEEGGLLVKDQSATKRVRTSQRKPSQVPALSIQHWHHRCKDCRFIRPATPKSFLFCFFTFSVGFLSWHLIGFLLSPPFQSLGEKTNFFLFSPFRFLRTSSRTISFSFLPRNIHTLVSFDSKNRREPWDYRSPMIETVKC